MHPDFNDAPLASDPLLFFGLSADRTETDLKRAYTALIRRWKPEKFPEEFKRLRTVYERLRATPPAKPSAIGVPSTPETSEAVSNPSREVARAPATDGRPASEILRNETRKEALRLLEGADSRLFPPAGSRRTPGAAGAVRPGFCLCALVAALMTPRPEYTDAGPLVAALERILAAAPDNNPRATLETFEPFEIAPFCFDVTADLWIAFSKKDAAACLMRLDRLLHFTDVGRQTRHAYFLLRFGVAGAFRLPLSWLREQANHLGGLYGVCRRRDSRDRPARAARSAWSLRQAGRV